MQKHETTATLKKKIKDIGYKSVCLKDSNGITIVPYNTGGKPLEPKFKEIESRFTMLPDGNYYIHCMYNYGHKGTADIFPINKGKLTQPLDVNLSQAPQIIKQMIQAPEDNFLSKEAFFEMNQKVTTLTIENEILKQRVSDLETDLEQEETEGLKEPAANNLTGWLSEIMPTVAPILDQYFSTRKRELDIKEASLQERHTTTQKQPIKKNITMWPNINDREAVEEFFNEIETLTDEQFYKVLEMTETEAPGLHALLLETFLEEEETNEGEGQE